LFTFDEHTVIIPLSSTILEETTVNLNVETVARDQRLDVEKFVEFASASPNAFVDAFTGQLITCTWLVDDLIDDFLAAGNARLPWARDPRGGLIQPGWLDVLELEAA
jgi:hypothetical protein